MSLLNYKDINNAARCGRISGRLIIIALLFVFALSLSSCGFWLFPFTKEQVVTYNAVGKDYKEVYDMAVASAREAGFNEITRIGRRDAGDMKAFSATRGFGVTETSYMRVDVNKKSYRGRYSFTLSVISTRGSDFIIKKFIKAFSSRLVIEGIKGGKVPSSASRFDLRNNKIKRPIHIYERIPADDINF